MKNHTLLILVTIIGIFLTFLAACGNVGPQKVKPTAYNAVKTYVEVPIGTHEYDASISYVFVLDGHEFSALVTNDGRGGASMIHHPGCPCHK